MTETARDITRLATFTSGALALAFAVWYVAGLHWDAGWLRDSDGYVLGRDFLNFWMMGKSGLDDASPGVNYDITHYVAQLQAMLGKEYPWQQWSYPPTLMLLMLPFAALPYLPAYAAWMVVNLGAFARVAGRAGWAALLSPAAVIGLVSGQISFLAAAAAIAAFKLMARAPILAGVLIGLLSIKPQLGILYPLLLIVLRQWKVFVSAAVTTLALLGIVWGIYGEELLLAYLTQGMPAQHQILEAPSEIIRCLMPTIFMDLRVVGASYGVAMLGHGVVAIAAAMALLHPYFRAMPRERQLLVFALASMLAMPYLMAYDALLLSYALLVGFEGYRFTRGGRWLVVAVYMLPLLHFIAVAFYVPGTALLPLLLLWKLLRAERGEKLI